MNEIVRRSLVDRIENIISDYEACQLNETDIEDVNYEDLKCISECLQYGQYKEKQQRDCMRCKDCHYWTVEQNTFKSWGRCSKLYERYTEDCESDFDNVTNYKDFCSCFEPKEETK